MLSQHSGLLPCLRLVRGTAYICGRKPKAVWSVRAQQSATWVNLPVQGNGSSSNESYMTIDTYGAWRDTCTHLLLNGEGGEGEQARPSYRHVRTLFQQHDKTAKSGGVPRKEHTAIDGCLNLVISFTRYGPNPTTTTRRRQDSSLYLRRYGTSPNTSPHKADSPPVLLLNNIVKT